MSTFCTQTILRLVPDDGLGPSITSASTSSPRWAGRQCMNRASGGHGHHVEVHAPVGKAFLRASFPLRSPLRSHIGGDQIGTTAGIHRVFETLQQPVSVMPATAGSIS